MTIAFADGDHYRKRHRYRGGSEKIMRSLGNQVPMRISDIPYIREKRHELDPAIFKHESVGSLANCTACHITAEKGIYTQSKDKKICLWGVGHVGKGG